MQTTDSNRRALLVGVAASAALLPFRHAIAQTEAAGGDWLAMVKSHHMMIAKSFDDLLAGKGPTKPGLKKLAYQLTAHSVAEENVLYPALAMSGMKSDSDKLYLDQAHAKVGNAEIDMDAMMGADKAALVDKIKTLQAAVLKHAKDDEEGDLFPKLQQKLDAKQNAALTMQYKQQFASVKPA